MTSQRFVYFVSFISVVVGVSVLLSWASGFYVLTNLHPSFGSMKANTALCFIFAGAALYFVQGSPKTKWPSHALAAIIAAISGLAFVEYILGTNLGVDQLLVKDLSNSLHTVYPGRMAPNTAVTFILLGLSFIFIDRHRHPADFMALAVMLSSLLATVGYANGLTAFYALPSFSGMAPHTALLFFLLSFGVLFTRPREGILKPLLSDSENAKVNLQMMLSIIILPIVLSGLCQAGVGFGWYGPDFCYCLLVVLYIAILGTISYVSVGRINEANAALNQKVQERTADLNYSLEALKASEIKFRSVTQSARDAIIAADSDGNIISWNLGATKIFGYQEEEVLGRPLSLIIPERFREAHRQGIRRFLETNEPKVIGKTVEMTAVDRNQKEFPVELSLTTWKVNDRPYFSGIIRDVSERKAAEAKIMYLSKMKALGEMAGGMAHEINNPLQIICLMAEKIEAQLGEKQSDLKEAATEIINTGHRIAIIIRSLRMIAGDTGAARFENASVRQLLNDVGSLCRQYLASQGITLIVSPLPNDLSIRCRPTQIAQVLLNMINNAEHAIAQLTEKWIKLEVRELETHIEFAISDSGGGIQAEIRDKIMQPFFTTKTVGQGMGLGLSISKGIIENHQGTLILDSSAANTRFIIQIPKGSAAA